MILMPSQACHKACGPRCKGLTWHGMKHTWLYGFKSGSPVSRIMVSTRSAYASSSQTCIFETQQCDIHVAYKIRLQASRAKRSGNSTATNVMRSLKTLNTCTCVVPTARRDWVSSFDQGTRPRNGITGETMPEGVEKVDVAGDRYVLSCETGAAGGKGEHVPAPFGTQLRRCYRCPACHMLVTR